MADRGRDLTFSILSDADKFDLDQPARDMDRLGQSADDAGKRLDRVGDQAKDAGRALDDGLSEDARTAIRELDKLEQQARDVDLEANLGQDAKDAARKVDSAFDTIARASKRSAADLDDDTGKMKNSLRDVGDEAGSTAREAAASFSSSGDIGDALQELAANAPSVLGPLGLAVGAAAGVGVGLWRAKMEALKESVDEMVDEMIEAGGRLSDAFIDNKVQELAKEGELKQVKALVEQYDILGVSYYDLARAKAGDAEAIDRVNAALDAESSRRKQNEDDLIRSEAAVAALRDQYDSSAEALKLAQEATEQYTNATSNSGETAKTAAQTARGAWDDLRGAMADPIRGKVLLQKPSRADYVSVRQDMLRGIGTLVIPVRPGQSRFTNNANNSRYRE